MTLYTVTGCNWQLDNKHFIIIIIINWAYKYNCKNWKQA